MNGENTSEALIKIVGTITPKNVKIGQQGLGIRSEKETIPIEVTEIIYEGKNPKNRIIGYKFKCILSDYFGTGFYMFNENPFPVLIGPEQKLDIKAADLNNMDFQKRIELYASI